MKEKRIKYMLIALLKYSLLIVILLSVYILSMMFVSLIPSKLLTEHVKQSSEVMIEEGERKHIDLGYKTEDIFVFTDALMLNITYSANPAEPLASAMLGRKNYIPGQTTVVHIDSQYNLGASNKYKNSKNGDIYQTKELYGLMHGDNITDSFEYARYWHGYTTILRPLLVIANYSQIRIIILILTFILVSLLLYKLYKRLDIQVTIIFLIGLLSVSIFTVTQGINEILVFLISLIFSIVLLSKKDLSKNLTEMFFIVGSITNFMDFLTAPLVTLGIPLIICILLWQKENSNLKDIFIKGTKICIAWCTAYAITWIMKWILAQLIYGRPVIEQSIEQARYRIGKDTFEIKEVLVRTLKYLSTNVVLSIMSLITIYVVGTLILHNKEEINLKQNVQEAIPYMITLFFPIIWFIVLKEHSFIHAFFTYRIYIISIISIFLIAYKLLKTSGKMSKKTDKKIEK